MADNPSDELEWEEPLPPFKYQDEVRERIQLLLPLAAETELKPTTKIPTEAKKQKPHQPVLL